jgi:hypothetical protein
MMIALLAGVFLMGCGGCPLIARRLRVMGRVQCPESSAVVQSGCAHLTTDPQRPNTELVFYSYGAASETYYGTCTRSFSTPREALHFIEDCRTRKLSTRYKPESPEELCRFTRLNEAATVQKFVALDTEGKSFKEPN